MLARTSHAQEDIIHTVNELVTVLNRTRLESSQNRGKINSIIGYLDYVVNRTARTWAHMALLDQEMSMRTTVTAVEALGFHVYRAEQEAAEMIQALEYGRLTEAIFPLPILKQILQKAQMEQLKPLPEVWYL